MKLDNGIDLDKVKDNNLSTRMSDEKTSYSLTGSPTIRNSKEKNGQEQETYRNNVPASSSSCILTRPDDHNNNNNMTDHAASNPANSPSLDVEALQNVKLRKELEIQDQSSRLPPKQLAIVCFSMIFAVMLASLEQTGVSTTLPAIAKSLNAGQSVSWGRNIISHCQHWQPSLLWTFE